MLRAMHRADQHPAVKLDDGAERLRVRLSDDRRSYSLVHSDGTLDRAEVELVGTT